MLKAFVTTIFLLFLAGPIVQAQGVSGNLSEIRVSGASESLERLIRINLSARVGTAVSNVNLEAERNRLLAMGTFSEVSLSIEERGVGPVMFVRVVENPRIAGIRIVGSSFPESAVRELLREEHVLEPGAIFNTIRAQEARSTLQRIYRNEGFPFDVPVDLDAVPVEPEDEDEVVAGQRPVQLTYTFNEGVPLREIEFEDSSVLDEEALEQLFAPLARRDRFDFERYGQALTAVSEAYFDEGYRNSGVDTEMSELEDGVLTVRFLELTIAGVDTTAIGVDPGELSLGPGDLFNYDVLLEDVRRLARERTQDIRLETRGTQRGEVRVVFLLGPPDSAGPIDDVAFEGNTVISDEDLGQLLTLEIGDTFTSELAREDFSRILNFYRERGYELVREADFNYLEGTYVQRLKELEIAGYQIEFEGDQQRTEERVITRYLPSEGSVLNQRQLGRRLDDVRRLGVVELRQVDLRFLDEERPEQATVVITVREAPSREFIPGLEATIEERFNLLGSVSYSDRNFLGRGNRFSANLTGQTSDVGFQLGGEVGFDIPWADIDFLDFREVPTSLSFGIFSEVDTNQPLFDDRSRRVPHPDDPDSEVLIGEYTRRDTGLRFSVGRPIFPNTSIRFSARASYSAYVTEPPRNECEFDEDGNVEDTNCSLPRDDAEGFLPQSGLSGFLSTGLTFDNRDSIEFPREGFRATSTLGFGFGSDFRGADGEQQSYAYYPIEVGGSTYLTLADLFEGVEDRNHVFAFRLNAGHQFGGEYPAGRRFTVGRTSNEARQIRGYQSGDFEPSRTYVTSSFEYRYDFELGTAVTQTVIGIGFIDVGWASSVPGFEDRTPPLFASAGVGLQINVGFGGGLLAPIRLDYGFSERNPSGVFGFRLGYVF